MFYSWFYAQSHWRLEAVRTCMTYRRTRMSRANKSNFKPGSKTTEQDIFSSWFYEQSYWRLGAARVFVHRRNRISRANRSTKIFKAHRRTRISMTRKKTWTIQNIEED